MHLQTQNTGDLQHTAVGRISFVAVDPQTPFVGRCKPGLRSFWQCRIDFQYPASKNLKQLKVKSHQMNIKI